MFPSVPSLEQILEVIPTRIPGNSHSSSSFAPPSTLTEWHLGFLSVGLHKAPPELNLLVFAFALKFQPRMCLSTRVSIPRRVLTRCINTVQLLRCTRLTSLWVKWQPGSPKCLLYLPRLGVSLTCFLTHYYYYYEKALHEKCITL